MGSTLSLPNAKIIDSVSQDARLVNSNNGLPLVAPRVTPVLDPAFRPAVLAVRATRAPRGTARRMQ